MKGGKSLHTIMFEATVSKLHAVDYMGVKLFRDHMLCKSMLKRSSCVLNAVSPHRSKIADTSYLEINFIGSRRKSRLYTFFSLEKMKNKILYVASMS